MLNMRRTFLTFSLLVLLLLPFLAKGEIKSFLGPRAVSLGEALRGAVSLTESLYLNPASSAFTETYALEMGFLGSPDAASSKVFNLSLLDTKTSRVGGGLSYSFFLPESGGGETLQIVQGALNYRFFEDFAGGIAARYFERPSDKRLMDSLYWNVGVLAKVLEGVDLGGVLGDINPSYAGARTGALGTRIRLHSKLYLSHDIVKIFAERGLKGVSFHSGIEILAKEALSIRAGHSFADSHRLSFGAGWSGGKVVLSYALSFPLLRKESAEHGLSFAVLF